MKPITIICLILLSFFSIKTYAQPCEIKPLSLLKGCAPHTVTLQAVNSTGKTPVHYDWSFGDGGNSSGSTLNTVTHVFTNPGKYNVHLIITFGDGSRCTTSISPQVIVFRPPHIPGFTLLSDSIQAFMVNGEQNKFCFQSPPDSQLHHPGMPGIARYIWNTGDGDTTHGANICHRYDAPGEYVVSLQIMDSNGCWAHTVRKGRLIVYNWIYFWVILLRW